MPAFSTSDATNEARGFPREFGAWNFEQYQRFLDLMNRAQQQGDWASEWGLDYNLNRARDGYASPTDIRSRGGEIMDIDPTLARRDQRYADILGLNAGRTPSGQTMGQIYDRYNDWAGDISRTEGMTQQEIDDLYSRSAGRNEDANRDFSTSLSDTYDPLRSALSSEFGGLRSSNADLTRGLNTGISGTVGELRGANRDVTGDLGGRITAGYSGIRSENQRNADDLLSNALDTYGGLEQDRERTYGDTRASLASTIGGLRDDAGQTYGDLERGGRDTYGRLRGDRERTFGDIATGTDEAYGRALADTESLRPQGDALAARTARSWAPAIADTQARLRRAGVGPNDLQYVSAMADVDARRAAAMDDAQAEGMGEYTDRTNALRLGQANARERQGLANLDRNVGLSEAEQAMNERLGLGSYGARERLGMTGYTEGRDLDLSRLSDAERQARAREQARNDIQNRRFDRNAAATQDELDQYGGVSERGLGRDAALAVGGLDRGTGASERGFDRDASLALGGYDRTATLGREQGNAYRDNLLDYYTRQQRADEMRSGASRDNLATSYGRTLDWRDAGNRNDLLARDMNTQDYRDSADLLREGNANDLFALDLRNQLYNAGRDWYGNDISVRDAAAGNVAGYGARQQQRNVDLARTAQGFGQGATNAYAQVPNEGGWGWSAIGGALGAGLNLLAPGAGAVFNGAMGGARGGAPASGGYGGYGGTPPFWSGGGGGGGFSWLSPNLQRQQQQPAQQPAAQPAQVYPWQQWGY